MKKIANFHSEVISSSEGYEHKAKKMREIASTVALAITNPSRTEKKSSASSKKRDFEGMMEESPQSGLSSFKKGGGSKVDVSSINPKLLDICMDTLLDGAFNESETQRKKQSREAKKNKEKSKEPSKEEQERQLSQSLINMGIKIKQRASRQEIHQQGGTSERREDAEPEDSARLSYEVPSYYSPHMQCPPLSHKLLSASSKADLISNSAFESLDNLLLLKKRRFPWVASFAEVNKKITASGASFFQSVSCEKNRDVLYTLQSKHFLVLRFACSESEKKSIGNFLKSEKGGPVQEKDKFVIEDIMDIDPQQERSLVGYFYIDNRGRAKATRVENNGVAYIVEEVK